jgi:hypothetical protein
MFMEPGERIELSTSSLPWKRSATELPRPSIQMRSFFGAGSRIRTCVGLRQLIYSQPQLATLVSRHMEPPVRFELTT